MFVRKNIAKEFMIDTVSRMQNPTKEDYKLASIVIRNVKHNGEMLILMKYISNDDFMEPYKVTNKEEYKEADTRIRKLICKLKELTETKEYMK